MSDAPPERENMIDECVRRVMRSYSASHDLCPFPSWRGLMFYGPYRINNDWCWHDWVPTTALVCGVWTEWRRMTAGAS